MGKSNRNKSIKRGAKKIMRIQHGKICDDFFAGMCGLPIKYRIKLAARIIFKRG